MRKKIFRLMAVVAVLSVGVACNKEIDNVITPEKQEQEKPESGKMTITVKLSDASTKVSFDPEFTGDNNKPDSMGHTWQAGDKLRITNSESVSETFELISGWDSPSGIFEGPHVYNGPFTVEVIPAGEEFDTDNEQTQLKDGDTSHLRFVAAATGVDDLDGIVLEETSQIIGIIAKLPENVATTVSSLEIVTSVDDFVNKTTIKVNLEEPVDFEEDNFLMIYANVPASWSIPANSKMLLRFNSLNENHTVYTRYQEFSDAVVPEDGKFNYIRMDCTHIDQYAGKSDDGTDEHPYLIADGYQMQALNTLLAAKSADTEVYAKLVDSIDLSVYANWIPIDASTRFIHFEGNDKVISNLTITSASSYPGLFGILYGTVQNLTISSASISGGAKTAGFLAGYLCSASGASIGCTIDKVTIEDSSMNGNGKTCGALAGCVGQNKTNTFAINISNVTVSNTTVETTNDCGGLLALSQGETSANRTLSISDCAIINSTIDCSGTSIRVGGLVGFINSPNTTIRDIVVKGTNVSGLSKAKAVGGIVGLVSSAADFDRCTYEKNGETTATVTGPTQHDGATGTAGAFVGGIAGEVSGDATFDDCHVKNATVTFTNPSENTNYWKYTGGAFGYVHSSGAKIGNEIACTVETVSVPAYHFCGGFIGCMNLGSIEQASVTGLTISGYNYVGGFVGQFDAGSIEQASVTDLTISGHNFVGGFVGQFDSGSIINCSVAGNTIQSANASVGGFAGAINGGSVESCSTSINVGDDTHKMGNNNGGFVGAVNGGTFEDCHASGNVYASGSNDGGFVGNGTAGSFANCSSRGTIKGSTYVAGFVGQAVNETFTGCYYEGASITATGSNKNGHVGGFVGRALTTASTFTNCHVGGESALTISSAAAQRCGGFIGQLDGLSPVTTISKCYVKNANISGPANTGGFVGVQYGPIDKCWVDGGSVTSVAGGNTGGFSAFIQNSGATANLTNCYSTADVDGAGFNTVGGLVGIANNSAYSIQYCYSTGTVSGTGSNKGGLVGSIAGSSVTVDKCISWNASLALAGTISGGVLSDNYVKDSSESGTVSSHAQESPRSWSSGVWDFTGDLPTLK